MTDKWQREGEEKEEFGSLVENEIGCNTPIGTYVQRKYSTRPQNTVENCLRF